MQSPDISFIVPIYNVEPYVEKCLQSLLKLQNLSFEVILIDDGSTDESGAICDSYAQHNPHFSIIHQTNQGLSEARNTGIRNAKGKWLFFLDSDDWLPETAGTTLNSFIEWECDIIYYTHTEVYEDGSMAQQPVHESVVPVMFSEAQLEQIRYSSIHRFLRNEFYRKNFALSTNKLVRRDFLVNNGISFEGRLIEDLIYSLKLLDLTPRVMATYDVLYYYRKRKGSLLTGYKGNARQLMGHMLESLWPLVNNHMTETMQRVWNARVITSFLFLIVMDFCHRDNPKPYRQRKRDFLETRIEHPYVEAFKNMAAIRGMPIERCVIAYLVKYKMFWAINLLSKLKK